jgi:hypothetical protein
MASRWKDGRSTDSIKANYRPVDDQTRTGYRRPPQIAGCVLDYFAELAKIEDGGKFAHQEMATMLDYPEVFFR